MEQNVTEKELQELDIWVRHTWKDDEKDFFYSTIMKLSNGTINYDSEEVKKLRELVAKNYDEYAENFVAEVKKQEQVIADADTRIAELEEKLSNKENYLLENYPAKIKDADLRNRINNATETINEYNQRRERLLEDKQKQENFKKQIEERISKIEEELDDIRMKNISATREEDIQHLSEMYKNLSDQKAKLEEMLEEYDNSEQKQRLEEELAELENRIKEEEEKKARLEKLRESNAQNLNGKVYDEHAIRLDQDELARTKAAKEAAENFITNNANYDYLDIFDRLTKKRTKTGAIPDDDSIPPTPPEEEGEIEVTKMTPWEWIKAHKKQILIGLGLAAIAVAIIVFVSHVIPAIAAVNEANVLNTMLANGHNWFGASNVVQQQLHAHNITLAKSLGIGQSAFNNITGAWTIGGKTLAEAAGLATSKASALLSALPTVGGLTIGTSLAGLTSIGIGVFSKERSDEYKKFYSRIKKLKENMEKMDPNEFHLELAKLENEICDSKKLSKFESKLLLIKLSSVAKKRKKIDKENINVIEPEQVEQTPVSKPQGTNEPEEQQDENDLSALEQARPNPFIALPAGDSNFDENEMRAVDENANEIDVELVGTESPMRTFPNGNLYEIDEEGNIILPDEEKAKSM